MRPRSSAFIVSLLAVAMSLLAGCITLNESVEPARFYTLADPGTTTVTGTGAGMLAGPFELPEYLNRPQLTTLGSNSEVLLSPTARWAEPLGDSVARRVASQLRVRLDRQQVYAFPSLTVRDVAYHATGAISRFEADSSGTVRLDVSWGVQDSDDAFVVGPLFSSYTEQLPGGAPTSDAAASEIVGAMGRLLDQFAAEIATASTRLVATD